jgi:methionine-rich copper-binding protein CopC
MRLIVVFMLLASPAFGHAILIDSVPAPEGHVHGGHVNVVLRYNSRIDAERSKLTLVRPDHSEARVPAAGGDTPDVLNTTLDLAPGDYVIRWQVLATDGHITRGDVPFTIDAPVADNATGH